MSCVAISPPVEVYSNLPVLASGSMDRTVKLWDISNGECCRTLQGYGGGVFAVAFSPDGQTLASGGSDRAVRLWDTLSGECSQMQGHTNAIDVYSIYAIAFSPDGQTLAVSLDGTVKLWDVTTDQCRQTLQTDANLVFCVAFSPDGQILASGSSDRTIRLSVDRKLGSPVVGVIIKSNQ